jgi:hypothetical protein
LLCFHARVALRGASRVAPSDARTTTPSGGSLRLSASSSSVTTAKRYLGPWVFVNTKVCVNIAYTGEEGSTQRGAQRCVQTSRTTSVSRSHTIAFKWHMGVQARSVHKRIAVYKQGWVHHHSRVSTRACCLQTGVGPRTKVNLLDERHRPRWRGTTRGVLRLWTKTGCVFCAGRSTRQRGAARERNQEPETETRQQSSAGGG